MAAYDLEEQEQLAELKAWWKQNGSLVLGTIALVLLSYSAWNGWRWYQRSQALEAAALYENLQTAARMSDGKAVRDAAGSILEKYAGTAYAPLAALVSAKANHQAGDLKTARAQLQWVVDNARLEETRAIARLRLAAVLMDDSANVYCGASQIEYTDKGIARSQVVRVRKTPGQALFAATTDIFDSTGHEKPLVIDETKFKPGTCAYDKGILYDSIDSVGSDFILMSTCGGDRIRLLSSGVSVYLPISGGEAKSVRVEGW